MGLRAPVGAMIAIALAVAACSGTGTGTGIGTATTASTEVTRTSDVPNATTTAPNTTTTAPPAAPGRLVVIDGSGDVVTMRPDGSDLRRLTDDGGVVEYRQPLWSPSDRRLLWSETTAAGFALVLFDQGSVISIPMPALPFFSMWAPDGTRIGVLHAAAGGGLELEIVDASKATTDVVATGAPFYFSWSPDGSQIVSHVGAANLSVLGADGVTVLRETAGDFQTPSWTAAGILQIADGALSVQRPDGDLVRIATVVGPTTIVAGPLGERIAVQVFGPEDPGIFAALGPIPEIPPNAVVVIDPGTGRIEVASSRPSFGFFWSPDGTSLLILVAGDREGEVEWWVWRDGEIITRVAFIPTASLVREFLPFFDQYAQAWRPWAPDSSAFAFVGTIGGMTGVRVQNLDDGEPLFLTEGEWVAWSAG
ncbi:MAG: PD40 domain-containing protein [Acidobacteria bacterium]|nr:PD40 domain-containing protein [Acidobacteriota bacterium]